MSSTSESETIQHARALSLSGCRDDAGVEELMSVALARARAAYFYGSCTLTGKRRAEAQEALQWVQEVGPEADDAFLSRITPADVLSYYESTFLQGSDPLAVDLWFIEAVNLLEVAEAFLDFSGAQRVAEGTLSSVEAVITMRPDIQAALRPSVAFERTRCAHRGWVLEMLDMLEGPARA